MITTATPCKCCRRTTTSLIESWSWTRRAASTILLYEMDYLDEDAHVNAVAMHSDGAGGYTALASIGGRVCLFDESGTECLAEALEVSKPNLGGFWGMSSTTRKNPGTVVLEESTGSKILWAMRRSSTNTTMLFEIPVGLFTKSVLTSWPLMKSRWTGSSMVMEVAAPWAWLKGLRCSSYD